jgi:hypothetical protein
MNTNAETGPGALEIAKLALAVAILIGGIGAFYAYEEQSLFVLILGIFFWILDKGLIWATKLLTGQGG